MFERFTERARKVVVLAQDESGRLRHGHVGTEHLLLGLIREGEGVAAQALHACGVTPDAARERVENLVGYGEDGSSQRPFTPRAKRVLELALREAQDLRHDHIGTEHLLLGLLAEGGGVAAAALSSLGVDPESARREVYSRIGIRGRSREGELGPLGWAREALRRSFGRYPRPEDLVSFERFTERARRVVVLAQDEARRFNHNYIGTEHLLLGLIREEGGIAGRVLREVGVDLDEAREQVGSIVGPGEEGIESGSPFTPRVSKVLRRAQIEAEQLDDDYVSTEHILLGLANETEGVAAHVFSNLGVEADGIRREVIDRLSDGGDLTGPPDEAALRAEGGRHQTLFRGRVGGIRTTAEMGPLILEVDYSYRLPVDPSVTRATLEPRDVAEVTLARLEEARSESLEGAVEAVGTHLMEVFFDVVEATVSAVKDTSPADPLATTFSVSATFRR